MGASIANGWLAGIGVYRFMLLFRRDLWKILLDNLNRSVIPAKLIRDNVGPQLRHCQKELLKEMRSDVFEA